MGYKLAIFDFDGTLADSFPWFAAVFNQLAARHQFKRLEPEELLALRGLSSRQLIQHLKVPWWKLPRIANDMRAMMGNDHGQIRVFAGAGPLLHRLAKQEVALAVVTSNAEINVRQILGPDLAALFRYYECGVSIFGKAARLKKVVRLSGVAPAESICIGDEIRDLEAAQKAGIPFGAVSWGYNSIEALQAHAPTALFVDWAQMEAVITQNPEPGGGFIQPPAAEGVGSGS